MNILICPDKFKDSLTAREAAYAIKEGLPEEHIAILVPMADGGEGSLEVIAQNLPGEWAVATVHDPLFRLLSAQYFISGNTAYIEMAKASGYELLTDNERDCTKTTTLGTGELIQDAIDRDVKNIVLFIGGSATNDGGIGVATALGYQFLDESGKELAPIGENLIQVREIRLPEKPLTNISFAVICDVTNPFYGPNGAAHVYAAQKGATAGQIAQLDAGLRNLAERIKKQLTIDIQQLPGAGAAGGLGGGAVAFLNAEIKSGTKTLIEITGLEEKIRHTDLIITGEGKFDGQSINGKLIDGICAIARKQQVPVWMVCGVSQISDEQITDLGISRIITLTNEETSVQYAIENAESLIKSLISEASQELR